MTKRTAQANMPTAFGPATILSYREDRGPSKEPLEHTVAIYGQALEQAHPLVRAHSACATSEIFRATNCDCREQLDLVMEYFRDRGGILIYLAHEGRGNGLAAKLMTMDLIMNGESPHRAFEKLGYPGDARRFGVVGEILTDLGVTQPITLLTNNPSKVSELEDAGVKIHACEPCYVPPSSAPVMRDLVSKRDELGHRLPKDMRPANEGS